METLNFCKPSESMLHRSYEKRVGGYWDIYPEKLDETWYEYWEKLRTSEEAINGHSAEGRNRLLTSFRFGSLVPFPRPGLTKIQKDKIVESATSREDFHDVDKIVSRYGTCLCELRFITGSDCMKFLAKGSDGETLPEGKNHWPWYIDINPRAFLCPHAKRNGLEADGRSFHCDILIKEPTEEWALAQEKSDPEGTLAGRVTSDRIQLGKCPQCDPKLRINPLTKRLLNPGFSNPLIKPGPAKPQPYEEPPDFVPWADAEDPPPAPWDHNLSIRPLIFSPEKDSKGEALRTYSRHFIEGRPYQVRSFGDAMNLYNDNDLVYDESGTTLAAHRNSRRDLGADEAETAQERKESMRRQTQNNIAKEMKIIVHERKVNILVNHLTLVERDYIQGKQFY